MTTRIFHTRVSNPWAFIILAGFLLFGVPIFATMGLSQEDEDTAAMEAAGQRAIALYCRDVLAAEVPLGYDQVPEDPALYRYVLQQRARDLARVAEALPECRGTLFLSEVFRHLQIMSGYERAATPEAPKPQSQSSSLMEDHRWWEENCPVTEEIPSTWSGNSLRAKDFRCSTISTKLNRRNT